MLQQPETVGFVHSQLRRQIHADLPASRWISGANQQGRWSHTYNDENKNNVFDKDDVFNEHKPIENDGRGKVPKVQYSTNVHTNALVPLYAKGPGAELFLKRIKGTDAEAAAYWNFSGQYVDDTDIFHVTKTVLAP